MLRTLCRSVNVTEQESCTLISIPYPITVMLRGSVTHHIAVTLAMNALGKGGNPFFSGTKYVVLAMFKNIYILFFCILQAQDENHSLSKTPPCPPQSNMVTTMFL